MKKNEVSMSDLAAITAKTGDEYAMFTKGGERLIIRGNKRSVHITPEDALDLAENGYRWSGHTHPGTNDFVLTPSKGDIKVLKKFNQDHTVIYNSLGRFKIIYK